MRVPYIVGRWVRDRNHYGRQRLFTYLLNTSDSAVWVVGARRIGKTSLLRQLEFLTDRPESNLVPLFWDMQGCNNSGDLSFELFMAVEDEAERFERLGVRVAELEGQDALMILRRLNRTLEAQGKTLLLLIDEAEVLINIARQEPGWLARLRRALQDGHQRTILTSTKLLAQLNEITAGWETSPFLFGFSMVNLWSLDEEAAAALVEQRQSEQPVQVNPLVVEDILTQTNRHPYLLQYLCQRLCVEGPHGEVTLRPIADEDLEPDHLLAGFFLIDYQHLTRLERRIVLTVAEHTVICESELFDALPDETPDRIRTFLWGLEKLGHVRLLYGQWAIGNEYLRRWLNHEWPSLVRMEQMPFLDEQSFEALLAEGKAQEGAAYQNEVAHLERDYAELLAAQHRNGASGDLAGELAGELDRIQRFLAAARRDLRRTRQIDGHHTLEPGSNGSADRSPLLRPSGSPFAFRARPQRDV